MNGFFVSNYDWEVSFKLPLSVIFPMTSTHISSWSFFDHNDIDKIPPKAQQPKPMFRAGNQIWLRTPACLAAYLFLELSFLIFVVRHQLFENLEKEPNLVEDAGMPGSLAISWTIDFIFVEKTSTNLVKSKAHLGKFQIKPTNNDKKREKDWFDLIGLQKNAKQNKTKKWKHKSVSQRLSHTHTQKQI